MTVGLVLAAVGGSIHPLDVSDQKCARVGVPSGRQNTQASRS